MTLFEIMLEEERTRAFIFSGFSIFKWIFFIVAICFISFSLWRISKAYSYSIGYRTLVEETVRDMVKAEALKDGK